MKVWVLKNKQFLAKCEMSVWGIPFKFLIYDLWSSQTHLPTVQKKCAKRFCSLYCFYKSPIRYESNSNLFQTSLCPIEKVKVFSNSQIAAESKFCDYCPHIQYSTYAYAHICQYTKILEEAEQRAEKNMATVCYELK